VWRVAVVFATHPERASDRNGASFGDFAEWRQESRSFEDMAAFDRRTYNLTGAGDPLRVQGSAATASLFRVWNLPAVRGRVFDDADDRPGAAPVVVLSHGFWARQFGSDPGVVGRTLVLNGRPHEVVGVLTPAVEIGTLGEVDVWTPLAAVADPNDREARTLLVTARLRPGVDVQQATAELRTLAERQAQEHPATNARWSAVARPIRRAMTGTNTWAMLGLMGVAVALVLAIACANVANLVLARGAARRRETAVRAALGASRARLVRQFLTEGAVLAVLGGAFGVFLAGLGLDFIRSVTFEPFFQLVTVDRRVMAFSAAISLLTPIIFGLVPALQATRSDVAGELQDAGRGAISPGVRHARGRDLLVVAQISLALSLLLVAGLAVRMAFAFQRLDLGFEPGGLLTLKAELPAAVYASDERVSSFYDRLHARLLALPGVSAVTVATGRPVLEPPPTEALAVEGREPAAKEAQPWAARETVGERYFETLGIPIVTGRSLGAADVRGAEATVVVSQAFVERYLAGKTPIGTRVRLGAETAPWRTIVGVCGNVLNGDAGAPPLPVVYVSFAQQPSRQLTVFLRAAGLDPVVAAARREVAALDPQQPLYDVKTMDRALFEALASNRVVTGLFVLFASVALGLAAIGLYGLVSYTVSQRAREIGVRIALGADRRSILRLVLGHGLRLAAAGVAAGLLVGFGLSRLMASILVGVSSTDPLTFTLVPLALGLVALAATAVPARRAARCDPAVVLRAE